MTEDPQLAGASPRSRPDRTDVALAACLAALGVVENLLLEHNVVVLVTAFAMALPLVVRRVFPLTCLVFVLAGFAAIVALVGGASDTGVHAVAVIAVAVASAASWHARPRAFAALGIALGIVLVDILLVERAPADAPFGGAIIAGAWAVGRLLRLNRLRNAELALRNCQLAAEHDARARAAVAEERARIARELHDVVGHAVTVMVVQCGAAQLVLREDPDRAELALEEVASAGREAMDEMRRTVGLLRRLDHQPEPDDGLGPQPGLGDLGRLAERVRAGGLEVQVDLPEAPVGLPTGLELSAYRIVQEALTNVERHSRAKRVLVRVRRHPRELELHVEDPGPHGRSRTESPGSLVVAHGITGMRERATLYGGTLVAAPTASGGFLVHARIPTQSIGA